MLRESIQSYSQSIREMENLGGGWSVVTQTVLIAEDHRSLRTPISYMYYQLLSYMYYLYYQLLETVLVFLVFSGYTSMVMIFSLPFE